MGVREGETDDGLVGWGECSDGRMPRSVAAAVDDFAGALIGQDARAVEKAYWTMYRIARQHLGGSASRAAAIELALWDIKARALGVSVCELKGGLMRERIRCTGRTVGRRAPDMPRRWGQAPRSYDDITALGKEVVSRGFTALKTNIVIPRPGRRLLAGVLAGQRRDRRGGDGEDARPDREADRDVPRGDRADVGIALDLNYNFRTDGVQRICKLLEQFKNIQWVEYDNWDRSRCGRSRTRHRCRSRRARAW